MSTSEIRHHIHNLVDEADAAQLGAILELLEPASARYTAGELTEFYNRIKLFEQNGSEGYSPQDSHSKIRNKHR